MKTQRPRFSSFVPAAAVGLATLIVAGAGSLAAVDGAGRPVAAVFPPWWDGSRALAEVTGAGGRPLRLGLVPSVVVAIDAEPGLIDRLYAAGAIAVLDPIVASGCLARAAGQ